MQKWGHSLYISILVIIEILVLYLLIVEGQEYYNLKIEERPFHESHNLLKPGGMYGHGYGIIGTLMITIGVFGYMARKRMKILYRLGRLKYWLEFHIFLCTLGPILIVFHSAFKVGGLISISFWSMVAVVLSGVIGRFIYIQIPKTISGEEISGIELLSMQNEITLKIKNDYKVEEDKITELQQVVNQIKNRKTNIIYLFLNLGIFSNIDKKQIAYVFKNLNSSDLKSVLNLVKKELKLFRKMKNLNLMKKLFSYWHVAHLPFALIMLVIAIVHVIVAILFGYTWKF